MVQKVKITEGGNFKNPTPGFQLARVLRIIDLGVHKQEYQGQAKDPKTELQFVFELSEDTVTFKGEEKPMVAFKKVTLSGGGKSKSNLEKILLALGADPKNADLSTLVGLPIGLTFSDEGKLESFSKVPEKKVALVPKLVAKSFFFDFDNPDAEILASLGTKTKEKLKEALNYSGSKVEALLGANESDESSDVV